MLLTAGLSAQSSREIVIHFNHLLGEMPFALEQASAQDGYYFSISRLQYYVSGIEIVHDGGTVTPLPDTWLLVNAATDVEFSLGTFNVAEIDEIEGMQFAVGVDPVANHLDPATYPAGHPLAYQFPSMHWGWASGYRFVTIEGYAGESLAAIWQIHALGDVNYQPITLSGAAVSSGDQRIFYVDADYREAVSGMDLTLGFIEHSETSYAADLMDNMASSVFSRAEGPLVASGWEQPVHSDFSVFPNPSADGLVTVQTTAAKDQAYSIQIRDLLGRNIVQTELPVGQDRMTFQLDQRGIYVIQWLLNGKSIAGQRIVVME